MSHKPTNFRTKCHFLESTSFM